MILSIVSQALVSFIIIIVLHYLYNFFKQNLTTPKVRDLINKPSEEYKRIYATINSEGKHKKISDEEKEKRKKELKNYMKSLTKNKGVNIQEDKHSFGNTSVKDTSIVNNEIQSFDLGNNTAYSAF